MAVSASLKKAQQKYRSKNKQKYLEYNRKARLKHYYNTKNYQNVDDMHKSFTHLFALDLKN